MSTLKFGVANDPAVGQTLTLAQCVGIAGDVVNGNKIGSVFASGSDSNFPNGGLTSGILTGPATLYAVANANLVIALMSASGDSCKYFRVTVAAP